MKTEHLSERFDLDKNIETELMEIENIMASDEAQAVKTASIQAILKELASEIVEAKTDLIYEDRTGFLGPKYGEDYLEKEVEVCKRYKKNFTIALLDIDYLKSINDKFGHVFGTKVIMDVADAIKKSVRTSDVVSRYGGDEFLIIFSDTNLTNARHSAYRIKTELDRKNVKNKVKVSVTFGLFQFNYEAPLSAEELITGADKELYKAKQDRVDPNA